MVDGAIVNEMTQCHSTHRCAICHKLPSEYRKLKPEDHTFSLQAWDAIENMVICKFTIERLHNPWYWYQSFLAPLHFGLRTFDHLFRLGCFQDIRRQCGKKTKYRIPKKRTDLKALKKIRRQMIQAEFKAKGMRIGFPNPKGKCQKIRESLFTFQLSSADTTSIWRFFQVSSFNKMRATP